ncbi:MAG: tripartite tricarboxylate transporter substrate binding protein [Burkholderiales bacterium]
MIFLRSNMTFAPIAAVMLATAAHAQVYPSGPMNMVVPFPPGGGTDILGRAIAQKLNEAWGQPVVVENRSGANGVIGTAHVARAAPDGHTMLIVPGGIAGNPAIRKNLPYDTLKDLAPVTQLASSPLVLSVHPSFPPRTVKELVAFAKARPGEVNFGTSGNGSPPHMAAELFKHLSGTRMTHIPYKGAGPAAIDLISGQIALYFMNALQVVPYVRSGQIRALGLTNTTRSAALPGVPTIAEAGVPGYDLTHWYGLFVRGGTPPASVNKLQTEMARILKQPDVEKRLTNEGATLVASTPDQFTAFLIVEMKKAAAIVKASGMTESN